jgi:uncharacterized protein (TIGR00106 family)
MPDAIVDVHIHPIGAPEVGVSRYVAESVRVLKTQFPSLRFQVNPMSTTIVGDLELILQAVRAMHEAQFHAGALRVSTSIRIDERRDAAALNITDLSGRVSRAVSS